MCLKSQISDWGSSQTGTYWTGPTWQQFKELLDRADDLDKKLGLLECADEKKAAWMAEVEERLKKAEKKLKKQQKQLDEYESGITD